MKRKLRILKILIISFGLSYAVWFLWSSPGFALIQIAHSLYAKDEIKFHRYVDVDRLAARAVESVVQSNKSENIINLSAFNLIQRHELRQTFKADIQTYFDVAKPEYRQEKKYHAVSRILRDSLHSIKLWHFFDYFEENARITHVGLNFSNDELNIQFRADLKLEKSRHWRLVEVSNADEIFAAIQSAMQARVQLANQPRKKILNEWIFVSDHHAHVEGKVWQLARMFHYEGTFHNFGDQDVDSFTALVHFLDARHRPIDSIRISGSKLAKGSRHKYRADKPINLLFARDRSLMRLPSQTLRIQVSFQELILADGQHIKLIESYEDLSAH